METEPMIYVENVSREEQWIVDARSGAAQRIGAGGLAKVTETQAALLVANAPATWRRVPVISLGPPVG